MRLSLRFVLPLLVVLGLVAYAIVPLVDALTLKWFTRDLESRSRLMASTMEAPLAELMSYQSRLNTLTGGQGRYTIAFSHYEAVPPGTQQKLVAQHQVADED